MKEIDIEQELMDLVASEEVLAFFNFVLPVPGAGETEGLCKVSHPRERNSRVTYVAMLFLIDAPDAGMLHAVDAHMRKIDWDSVAPSGVSAMLAVPHRSANAGLFLKEVDVYLEDGQSANAAFVRGVLQPVVARATGMKPGELTVWEESAPGGAARSAKAAAAAPAEDESIVGRLRRFVGI